MMALSDMFQLTGVQQVECGYMCFGRNQDHDG